MMDAAEEIPLHRVEPCVDRETEQPADAVSKVLGDDNLLREIIVRVGFPTTLVLSALVSKRWYHHASDPAFLHRFRKLHPPCLLGYYISEWWVCSEKPAASRFVPMLPQPPELATVIHRVAACRFGAHDDRLEIEHCQDGIVFTRCCKRIGFPHGVHCPLCPESGIPIFPPFPIVPVHDVRMFSEILFKEGDGSLSYLYVLGTMQSGEFTVRVYVLQDGVWRMHTSATCQLHPVDLQPKAAVIDNKIYMTAGTRGDIIVLDLTTSSFSTIPLPQGVTYNCYKTKLSPADDASGVYLIHVNEFQLHIWLHKGDKWFLIDTLCLRMLDHTLEDKYSADVLISQVGDNADFLFLRMGGCTFYLDVMNKTLRKVHDVAEKNRDFSFVNPFMMIWPPIFPVLKDDTTRNAM